MWSWFRTIFVRRANARPRTNDQDRPGEVLNLGAPPDSSGIVDPSVSADLGMHVHVMTLAEAGKAEHSQSHNGAFDVVDLILAALLIGIAVLASYFWNRSWSSFSAPRVPASVTGRSSAGGVAPTRTTISSRLPATPSSQPGGQTGASTESGVANGTGESRLEPVLIVPASYTNEARYAHFHGRVYVVITVSRQGMPSRIELTAPLAFDLEPVVRQAVGQWRFRPAIRSGQPVEATAVFEVPFR